MTKQQFLDIAAIAIRSGDGWAARQFFYATNDDCEYVGPDMGPWMAWYEDDGPMPQPSLGSIEVAREIRGILGNPASADVAVVQLYNLTDEQAIALLAADAAIQAAVRLFEDAS